MNNPQEAHEHADQLQSQIDDLETKAQSSSGEEKQGYMQRIQILNKKKDGLMNKLSGMKDQGNSLKEKSKGYLDKLGM
jgi:uncharacterized coiled-coil DUF342 family protein